MRKCPAWDAVPGARNYTKDFMQILSQRGRSQRATESAGDHSERRFAEVSYEFVRSFTRQKSSLLKRIR